MFIAILVMAALLSLKFADWKNWERYHTTMLFFIIGNLFYNFVYHDHFLWKFEPDIIKNNHIMEIIYSFTVYPLTALMYLSGMPLTLKKKIVHTLLFIGIYTALELLLSLTGRMVYNYGWNFGFSVLWNLMMFPLLALHNKKPLFAYGFCVALIFTMNWLFPYNLK